jgi:cell division protein FtsL
MNARLMKTFVLGMLVVCLLALLGIYWVWQHHRLVQAGGELARSEQVLRQLKTENELLEAEYRTLRSGSRFEAGAFTRLKMKAPSSLDIVYIDPQAGVGPGSKEHVQ